jgi:hypothetical protein
METSDYITYNKIHNFLDIIKQNPKKDVNYFFFDENKRFIVLGEKLKSLPAPYHKHYTREEFYVHVDIINRRIQFYVFDIKDYMTGERINESGGTIIWCKEIEDSIYNFFALHIKELSSATYPYSGVADNKPKLTQSYSGIADNKPTQSYAPYTKTYEPSSYTNTSYYGSPAYKEREAFFDKINELLKYNKTAQATDYIFNTLNKMGEEKKLNIIDDIFRVIAFDKLNIPTMVSILEATKSIEGLKDRGLFFGKVKTHIQKLKPNKVDMVLKRVA